MKTFIQSSNSAFPPLDYASWKDTLHTLHMWTQIIGKIRLKSMPWQNHSWHSALYITDKGLSTGSIPYGNGIFAIEFDFSNHQLVVSSTFTNDRMMKLYDRSVADFYQEVMITLASMGIQVDIYAAPNEVEKSIPFVENEINKSYDSQAVVNFWQAAISIHNVFLNFRSQFIGKCSPVHFFWGAFDIALTRFSGRPAPLHPGGAANMPQDVMQEAYSHEVSSCGFWPGGDSFPQAAFYSYCYPTPEAFGKQSVLPEEAFYSEEMGEYFLAYDAVRNSPHPEKMLMEFLQTTYEAVAETGNWNREQLEKKWK